MKEGTEKTSSGGKEIRKATSSLNYGLLTQSNDGKKRAERMTDHFGNM